MMAYMHSEGIIKDQILEAIDELIDYYGEYSPNIIPLSIDGNCPLCDFEATYKDLGSPCSMCPWHTIEGLHIVGNPPCVQGRFPTKPLRND